MPMTQHFSARTQDGKDVFAELQDFANGIGLEQAAPDRYSFLLAAESAKAPDTEQAQSDNALANTGSWR